MPHFRHAALLYTDEDAFLAGTVPYVREAAAEGAPVLAALGRRKTRLLRDALGDEATAVSFADIETLGRNPSRIISLWRAFVDDNAGSGARLRGLGEPAWSGRSSAALGECGRQEALINLAFGGERELELLCPYDASGLDAGTLNTARCTHPVVIDAQGERPSRDYDPEMPAQVFHGTLPEPAAEVDELEFGRTGLREVRGLVARRAEDAGLDARGSGDITLAASELAANSVRYGDGGGTIRVWEEPGELLCEVRDSGRMHDPMAGRVRPRADHIGGRGLWLVNHLCDLVEIRSSAGGTVVRLHTALPNGS